MKKLFSKICQGASGLQHRAFGSLPVGAAVLGTIALTLGASGCQSRYIDALIVNDTGSTLHVVELDYPGASFGVSTLAPHANYRYHFKLLGSGQLTLSYMDAGGRSHASAGPTVVEGSRGGLAVRIEEAGIVRWTPSLRSR